MKSRRQIAATFLLLLVGCATTQQDREDAAREIEDRLVAETRDYFAAHPEPLTFTNALAIARERSLKLTQKELDVQLAKITSAAAFSAFLPNVVLGGGGASLSLESVAVRGWAGSLAGVWSIFGGFRTVQEYRAARAMREAEFRLNEDRMLAVVVSVADCWRNLETARAGAAVAAKGAEATALIREHRELNAGLAAGGEETCCGPPTPTAWPGRRSFTFAACWRNAAATSPAPPSFSASPATR